MNIQFSKVVVLAVAALGATGTFAQQQPAQPSGPIQLQGMQQLLESVQLINQQLQGFRNVSWEYLFLQRNRLKDSKEQLKQLGQDGWELVAVTVEEGFILKRRRR